MSTRKKQRRNIVLTALEVIFLCIFLFALFQAGKILFEYHEGDSFYEDSQDTIHRPRPRSPGWDAASTSPRTGR